MAIGAVAVVLVPYVALGGASFEPAQSRVRGVPRREWRDPGGLSEALEQIALSALDGAACELGVSREDLVLAVRDEDALDAFAVEHGITRADAERADRAGLVRAVDDAEDAGALPGFVASLAREVAGAVPPWLVLEALERLGSFRP